MKKYKFQVSCDITVEEEGESKEDARTRLVDGLKYLRINPNDFYVSGGRLSEVTRTKEDNHGE